MCSSDLVRTKDANDQIFADAMRPENPKRVMMRAREKHAHFIRRHADDLKRTHARRRILNARTKMSGAWMRGGVGFFQTFDGDVRVDLRRRKTGVA